MDPDVICFHLINEPNGYLSNWYPAEFSIAGTQYCCVEQRLMHAKAILFSDNDATSQIMATENPAEMKKIGRKIKGYNEQTWAHVRKAVAYEAAYERFAQNPIHGEMLIATGNASIAECAVHDYVWGIGLSMTDPDRFDPNKWQGSNLLGEILVEVRKKLAENGWLQTHLVDGVNHMQRLHALAVNCRDLLERVKDNPGPFVYEMADSTMRELIALHIEMDCGHSYGAVYGPGLGDIDHLKKHLDSITDPKLLAMAIFSNWRYWNHWSFVPFTSNDTEWFKIALDRLVELTADNR